MLLAIDPGNAQSGFVVMDMSISSPVISSGVVSNDEMLAMVGSQCAVSLAVEGIASYGMPVGAEVFDTCIWIGRFIERFGADRARLVFRKDIKLHLCGTTKAKDANVRQALIDRFGGKDKAIGRKAAPGPLYQVKSHAWSALAVALTALEAR